MIWTFLALFAVGIVIGTLAIIFAVDEQHHHHV